MSVSEVPEARPENPERLHPVRLSNRAHRATAKPQWSPSSSSAA